MAVDSKSDARRAGLLHTKLVRRRAFEPLRRWRAKQPTLA